MEPLGMYSQTHLYSRKDHQTYCGRRRVPLDIQRIVGKKELKRSTSLTRSTMMLTTRSRCTARVADRLIEAEALA